MTTTTTKYTRSYYCIISWITVVGSSISSGSSGGALFAPVARVTLFIATAIITRGAIATTSILLTITT